MKVLLPDTIDLELDLDAEAPGHDVEFVTYDVTAPIPAEHRNAEVLVVWANTPENLRDAAEHLTALRLVQTLAAGPDAVVTAGFAASVAIASGRSLHDGPVAEHALALTLAAVRRLDELGDAQRRHEWDSTFLAAQTAPATRALYTLAGSKVAIWGFGSIAQTLAPMLELLGAQVTGIASTAGERGGYPVIANDELPEALGGFDVLISLLPASEKTDKAFGSALIGRLKPGAVFVNVGRGATVDEDALVTALQNGTLRVAAIDVTREEPLPAGSPLWTAPNLILTPHAAGNRPVGASGLVERNLLALLHEGELTNRV